MRRNSIYLRSNLSEKELSLLKLDLINNSIYFVSKIKNFNLDKSMIEEVVKNSVERVISVYRFGKDGSLGDLVKNTVIVDLKHYYENTYPDQANKVIWPCLDKRAPFDKLLEVLEKVKLQSVEYIEEIYNQINGRTTKRQQDMLWVMYRNPNLTYAEVSKLFGKRGVMTYRQITIIYNQLIQILKDLEINL